MWSPKITITTPAIFAITFILSERNLPTAVADAPSKTKTIEKPRTKNIELSKVLTKNLFELSLSLNSSNDKPEMKEIYPGTSGRTQGERKERIPNKKEVNKPTLSILQSPNFDKKTRPLGGH